MSNQGFPGHSDGQQGHNPPLPATNPWADQESQQAHHEQSHYQVPQYQLPQQDPWQQQQGHPQQQQQQQQHPPPPSDQSGYQAPPNPPPRRSDTFNETSFVPEEERGEQREAFEHFEMQNSKPESQTDRDVAQLQHEFPGLDGSLIAALYGDSQSLGATREMLRELASTSQ